MQAARNLRRILLTASLVLALNPTLGQTVSRKSPQQAVADALRTISSGYYTGSTEKDLETLGDSGSVELIKSFAGRELDAQDIKSGIEIIRMSFSAPKLIATDVDRQPKAAMLLLRYFSFQAKDPALKRSIADTVKLLQALQQ